MGEIEAWKATGRRALRIARQRGWTDRPLRLTLLGAGTLALVASAHVGHPMVHHSSYFERRVVALHMSHGAWPRSRPYALQRGTVPLAPLQPPAAPAAPVPPAAANAPDAPDAPPPLQLSPL